MTTFVGEFETPHGSKIGQSSDASKGSPYQWYIESLNEPNWNTYRKINVNKKTTNIINEIA
jgi:hypothetical protein